MPAFVKHDDLDNFINIFQKYISRLRQFNFDESFISLKILLEGNSIKITKLIELSELFENNSFSIILIKDCILSEKKDTEDIDENHTMNINNVIILLHLSYNKLKEINNKDKQNILINSQDNNNNLEVELETTWLDLFIKSLEMIGNNLSYYFENDTGDKVTSNKLWSFDKKIIDELYEKYSLNLITNNFIINENEKEIELKDSNIKPNKIDLKQLNKIIDFLIQKRNQSDFFSLLSNEFMRIISEENINEINSLPNPTFILKVNINDINNYYEEYPINNSFTINDTTKLIIVVYYKKNDDSFNVSLKLSKEKNNRTMACFDIITFLSLALVEEINNRQINVKSLTNNKSMYEILKINNFKKLISKIDKNENSSGNEYFTLKLFLKPCFIYTMLCNYLFYNIENLYTNKNICKLSKNLLSIIIRKKQLLKNEEENNSHREDSQYNNVDKIVMCLINWLNDEVNVGEDISEIIKSIKWDHVSLPLIFEFLIKYAIHIISDDIEYIFSKSLAKILKQFELDLSILSKEIIHSLILSSKKMNYISMFCENKKMKKFNLYEIMNKRRNISLQNDKKNENNTSSLANSINNKNEASTISNNQNTNKDGHEIKKNETKPKNKIKIGINNSSIETKYLNNNKNNISFINNNSDIYYNNYFTNCHNNFNINIYKANKSNNDKKKKNFSQINKKKVIISQIKIRKENNTKFEIYKKNNIKINNRSNVSPNIKSVSNSPDSYSPKMKERLNKINTNNNILNKTINYKNSNNNFDKKLIKDKCERNQHHKTKKNRFNSTDIKNKTCINPGQTNLNFKKNYHQKNINEYLGKASNKKDKNKTQISLLNELLNINKKGKKDNNSAIKINQSVNIKKQNLTQIHIDNK